MVVVIGIPELGGLIGDGEVPPVNKDATMAPPKIWWTFPVTYTLRITEIYSIPKDIIPNNFNEYTTIFNYLRAEN